MVTSISDEWVALYENELSLETFRDGFLTPGKEWLSREHEVYLNQSPNPDFHCALGSGLYPLATSLVGRDGIHSSTLILNDPGFSGETFCAKAFWIWLDRLRRLPSDLQTIVINECYMDGFPITYDDHVTGRKEFVWDLKTLPAMQFAHHKEGLVTLLEKAGIRASIYDNTWENVPFMELEGQNGVLEILSLLNYLDRPSDLFEMLARFRDKFQLIVFSNSDCLVGMKKDFGVSSICPSTVIKSFQDIGYFPFRKYEYLPTHEISMMLVRQEEVGEGLFIPQPETVESASRVFRDRR
jgi:hypothetical protein